MIALALVVHFALANVEEVEPSPEIWAGEQRRVHFGLGLRVHGGLMSSGGAPLWLLQSELLLMLSIRLRGHDELRVQLGLGPGYPDTFGGETNVTFHHAFSPRVSLGIGGFVYWGFWSIRLGVEAPLIIRLGSSRRHLLLLALRVHAGVFNNLPILAWSLASQRFAVAADLALGYAFQF
jgi:hypothetical protein